MTLQHHSLLMLVLVRWVCYLLALLDALSGVLTLGFGKTTASQSFLDFLLANGFSEKEDDDDCHGF